MTTKKYDRFENFEDVKKWHEDIRSNFSFDDIGVGNLKTEAPTTQTMDKGKFRLVEESGVPYLYYRAIDGTIYKFSGAAV